MFVRIRNDGRKRAAETAVGDTPRLFAQGHGIDHQHSSADRADSEVTILL